MAEKFRLRVVTPEEIFYEKEVQMTEFTTAEGRIGIYRDHAPLTAVLAPGVLRIHEGEAVREAELISGLARVEKEAVVLLAETAKWR